MSDAIWQPLADLLPAWTATFEFTLVDALTLQQAADAGAAGDTSTHECELIRRDKQLQAVISIRVDRASRSSDLTQALQKHGWYWSTHDLKDDTAWFSRMARLREFA